MPPALADAGRRGAASSPITHTTGRSTPTARRSPRSSARCSTAATMPRSRTPTTESSTATPCGIARSDRCSSSPGPGGGRCRRQRRRPANPHNVFDAALSAGRYLCAGFSGPGGSGGSRAGAAALQPQPRLRRAGPGLDRRVHGRSGRAAAPAAAADRPRTTDRPHHHRPRHRRPPRRPPLDRRLGRPDRPPTTRRPPTTHADDRRRRPPARLTPPVRLPPA